MTLPNLTHLHFRGVSVYIERLVAQITAPLLKQLDITFFNQLTFTLPHLSNFIVRTERLVLPKAKVAFLKDTVFINLLPSRMRQQDGCIVLRVTCKPLDWQIDCLAQVCSALMPALSGVENLTIDSMTVWQSGEPGGLVEGTTWQELLRSFTGLKKLGVCDQLLGELSSALEVGGIGSDPSFLPSLQGLVVDVMLYTINPTFSSFIRARQVAGLPGDIAFHSRPPPPSPSQPV